MQVHYLVEIIDALKSMPLKDDTVFGLRFLLHSFCDCLSIGRFSFLCSDLACQRLLGSSSPRPLDAPHFVGA